MQAFYKFNLLYKKTHKEFYKTLSYKFLANYKKNLSFFKIKETFMQSYKEFFLNMYVKNFHINNSAHKIRII